MLFILIKRKKNYDSSSGFIIPVSKEVNLERLYVYKDKGTDGK